MSTEWAKMKRCRLQAAAPHAQALPPRKPQAGAPCFGTRDNRGERAVGAFAARGGEQGGGEPCRAETPLRDRRRPLLRGRGGRIPRSPGASLEACRRTA